MTEDQAENLAQAVEVLSKRMDALKADLGFACESPTIVALMQRKAAIEADIAAGQEQLAAVEQQQAALTERARELDQRERQIKVREYEFEQRRNEAMAQLRADHSGLAQANAALKARVMNFSGMLSGFEFGIMEPPPWDAIERMLGVTDAIPEMRAEPTEDVAADRHGLPFLGSLTRSTPMSEHDDLPMPVNKPRERSSRSRYTYRRAMRAAMAKP